jgi:hypothetical protein
MANQAPPVVLSRVRPSTSSRDPFQLATGNMVLLKYLKTEFVFYEREGRPYLGFPKGVSIVGPIALDRLIKHTKALLQRDHPQIWNHRPLDPKPTGTRARLPNHLGHPPT